MFEFRIAETKTFDKVKNKLSKDIYNKISTIIYPQLTSNPFFGPNIKKLKGEFSDFYRYRTGNYRLFYLINTDKKLVIIADFKHRKDAY